MSSHFKGREEVERKTGLSYLLSPSRPLTPGEIRFRNHGYFRAAGMMLFLLYLIYCNPELSYSYTALREHCGWDTEGAVPLFPQYLKLKSHPFGTKLAAHSLASREEKALSSPQPPSKPPIE